MSSDDRLDFPATSLNREPIASALARFWDPAEAISFLEVASGSGQHAAFFARRFPHWTFQPSDLEPAHRASIEAYRREASENLRPALTLDVEQTPWPLDEAFDGLLAINLIHISPWACTEALMREAARLLRPGGGLYLYGAFRREGVPTAPSNEAFDQSLRAQNGRWGVRSLERVGQEAELNGLLLGQVVEMPANNLSVLFRRPG